MGAWRFVHEQVQPLLAQSRRLLEYVGRPESPSPATGSHRRHVIEQQYVIERAFGEAAPARPEAVRRQVSPEGSAHSTPTAPRE